MAVQSKLLPSHLFDMDRQMVTRYQERTIRDTFDFLGLPAEIRNMLYKCCIDLHGVEKYFDRLFKSIDTKVAANKKAKVKAPDAAKTTPVVLLLCRQTYFEASVFIAKLGVRFDHGLLSVRCIDNVISEDIIRNIRSITITDKGHVISKPGILNHSWRGYMDIVADLARILSTGPRHKLKNLSIEFTDPNILFHITCWHSPAKCDFRDHITDAFGRLYDVRSVGQVTIKGIEPVLAARLTARMESTPKTFFDLPAELRNRIYALSTGYNVSTHLGRLMKFMRTKSASSSSRALSKRKRPGFRYHNTTTPNILLINRQIYSEAHAVIFKQPLNIIFPKFNATIDTQDEVPDFMRLISANTLQKITHINMRIESWEWLFTTEKVFAVLKAKHNLQSFRFHFHDFLKPSFMKPGRFYPDGAVATALRDMTQIRGVPEVVFQGDLPAVYTVPVATAMMSTQGTMGLPKAQAMGGDGVAVELQYEE